MVYTLFTSHFKFSHIKSPMVYTLFTSLAQSPLPTFSHTPYLNPSKTFLKRTHTLFLNGHTRSNHLSRLRTTRPPPHVCFSSGGGRPRPDFQEKENEGGLQILKRWDVPWEWQTVSLTSLACGLSFVLTGLVEAAVVPYLGLSIQDLSLDEKAEFLLVAQGVTTAAILGVLYTFAGKFQPLPQDIYRYDWREPFSLQRGWLLWAGIGLVGAVAAVALTGAATSFFSGQTPEREKDALVSLLPLIGSSSISTACLLGITGVLAPILEETVFRGFFMVSMTKWVPTPVAVVISAAVFALAHLTPGEFPQLFVLGAAMGLSYAQTRNLLTPITIHAFWNSGVILLLTFLQLQGYDIKELLQAT